MLKHILLFPALCVMLVGAGCEKAEHTAADAERTDDQYAHAIELGGEWFLNNQNEEFLYYEYHPETDSHPDESQRLREMGALWSITQLANFTGDARYTELAMRGMDFFNDYLAYDNENDFSYINILPSAVKLGYNAFLILSLIEVEYPDKEQTLERLANGILFHQKQDGSLSTFFYSDRNTGVDYYPGEALLALMSLYETTGNEAYADAVEAAFPYYRQYWNDHPNTAFPPWQSRAYKKLYDARPSAEVADFIFSMNDYMLGVYAGESACEGFALTAGSVVAVHAEGVAQAYELSEELGEDEQALCYGNFVREAADYMLSLQVGEDTEWAVPAVGGFMGSATSSKMRVDRNQHAVLLLMDAYSKGILLQNK